MKNQKKHYQINVWCFQTNPKAIHTWPDAAFRRHVSQSSGCSVLSHCHSNSRLASLIVALAFLSGTNSALSSYNTFKQLTTSTIKFSKLSGGIDSFFACVSAHAWFHSFVRQVRNLLCHTWLKIWIITPVWYIINVRVYSLIQPKIPVNHHFPIIKIGKSWSN